MLINQYMQGRNTVITTGIPQHISTKIPAKSPEQQQSFAAELRNQLEQSTSVEFSNHAINRLGERGIDLSGTMERFNRGVEIAREKGSNDSLILIDKNAFIVSIKNNKVVTTMSNDDLTGNIFTNIDSTVII